MPPAANPWASQWFIRPRFGMCPSHRMAASWQPPAAISTCACSTWRPRGFCGSSISPARFFGPGFSADGNRILTACVDGGLRLHSSSSLELVLPPMRHKGIVWTAEFSPDGTRLLSTSADRTAQLWNAQTGQPMGNPMRHPKGVQMVMFSADGRRVATGSEDGTARVWDAMTGEPLSPPLRRPNPTALNAIRFSPDGRWLLTMDLRGAYLWDAQTGLSISEAM